MAKKKSDIQVDSGYSKKLHVVTIIFTVILAIAGFYPLVNGWGFFDPSLIYFLIPFIIAVVVFYIAMMAEQIALIAVSVLIAIVSVVFMSNSVNWRQAYVEKGFVLEAYIDEYPSYMTHLMTKIGMNDGDVVAFARDCLGSHKEPKMINSTGKYCKSLNDIQKYYGVDLEQILMDYHAKMQTTAKRIEQGQAMQLGYPLCINTKKCAYIPLPPAGMTEQEIKDSTDVKISIIRDGFWDLIEKKAITANVCANMYLCNRLVEIGVIGPAELKNLQLRQDPDFYKKEETDPETTGQDASSETSNETQPAEPTSSNPEQLTIIP